MSKTKFLSFSPQNLLLPKPSPFHDNSILPLLRPKISHPLLSFFSSLIESLRKPLTIPSQLSGVQPPLITFTSSWPKAPSSYSIQAVALYLVPLLLLASRVYC